MGSGQLTNQRTRQVLNAVNEQTQRPGAAQWETACSASEYWEKGRNQLFSPITYLLNLVANLLSPEGNQEHVPLDDFALQRQTQGMVSSVPTFHLAALTLPDQARCLGRQVRCSYISRSVTAAHQHPQARTHARSRHLQSHTPQ